MINLTLVRNKGKFAVLDNVFESPGEREKMPAEKDRDLWLVQGQPTVQSLLAREREEMEVLLVPREERPSHSSFLGCLLRGSRSHGERCKGTRGSTELLGQVSRVTCPRREGRGFTGVWGSAAAGWDWNLRHVDVTPVVFQTEDGKGRTKDFGAECRLANNGGQWLGQILSL